MGQKLLLAVLAGSAFLWAIRRWQTAARVVMVVLIVEGALRKWVFPESQQLMYFAKDVVLLGCYAGFVRARGAYRYRVAVPPMLMVLLSLGAAFGAFQIFNPDLPNVLVGILGFKAYFFYVPLMFVLPACFENDQQLSQFLRRYCLAAIPVALVGMLQFASSSTSAVNAYAGGTGNEGGVVTFGSSERVRITGTFSFITGYTTYLLANATLMLSIIGASRWRFAANRKLYLALGLTLLGILMSGSRGPLVNLALMFPFYWYLAVMRERDAGTILGRAGLVLGVVVASIVIFGSGALSAFVGRASGTTDLTGRMIAPFIAPFDALGKAGALGYGIGSTHQMAVAVAPSIVPYAWLEGNNTELESGRIMLELGPIGFLLIYLVRIAMVFIAFHHAKRLRTRFHRALCAGAFLFFLAETTGAVVFDVTCGVFYWFFAGLMTLVIRLDRQVAAAPQPAVVTPRERPPSRLSLDRPAAAAFPRWSTRPGS